MRCILSLLVLTVSMTSLAGKKGGGQVGNGGDALVCYEDNAKQNITTVRMFDYWENDQVYNLGEINLGDESLSVEEKINLGAQRAMTVNPALGRFIQKLALDLARDVDKYLVDDRSLEEIDDVINMAEYIPENCFIEQFAVQYNSPISIDQRLYRISARLYNFPGLSKTDKAGLFLHEAIYRYTILKSRPQTSNKVRFFNYLLAASAFDPTTWWVRSLYMDYRATTMIDAFVIGSILPFHLLN